MKKAIIILIHAFIGWALCAAVMGAGMALLPLNAALVIHAFAAPVIFFAVSIFYFKIFNYTDPLKTAVIFVLTVIFLDFFVVALLIVKSFDMFRSLIGTWLPFTLIFLSTWAAGSVIKGKVK